MVENNESSLLLLVTCYKIIITERFWDLQQESEKQLGERLSAAIEERDIFWQEKMAELERSHAELLESKVHYSCSVFLLSFLFFYKYLSCFSYNV